MQLARAAHLRAQDGFPAYQIFPFGIHSLLKGHTDHSVLHWPVHDGRIASISQCAKVVGTPLRPAQFHHCSHFLQKSLLS